MYTLNDKMRILGPGYLLLILGIIADRLFTAHLFLPGVFIGLVWFLAGMIGLYFVWREKRASAGLARTGFFTLSRHPDIALHLLAVMPGLCLLFNTNIGILGIVVGLCLFPGFAKKEERELEERFGEEYRQYASQVQPLIPNPFSAK